MRAGALAETCFTVWANLFQMGRLAKGEKVLIHGGASGIGTTAIQLAKAFGATVFTTVRTPEKAKAVKDLGADHAIIYKDNDWAAEVKKLSGGVDVVLDMVAGEYLPKNLGLLKLDGRCVVIAVQLVHGLDVGVVRADFQGAAHAHANALDIGLAVHIQHIHAFMAGRVARAYVDQEHIAVAECGRHAFALGMNEL